MAEQHPTATGTDPGTTEKPTAVRTPRGIRFSDSEWDRAKIAAAAEGVPVAEFVRNAVLSRATNNSEAESTTIPSGIVELIKHTYRSTYILSTVKRDEMIREGREDQLDETIEAARNAQAALLFTK